MNQIFGDFITEVSHEIENPYSGQCSFIKFEPTSDAIFIIESDDETTVKEEKEVEEADNCPVIEKPHFEQNNDLNSANILTELQLNVVPAAPQAIVNNNGSITDSMEKPLKKRPLQQNDLDVHRPNKKQKILNISESKRSSTCEICQKRIRSSMELIFHRKRHLSRNSINCRICLRFFSSKQESMVHENQCNERRYDCYACGMILSGLAALENHFRTHTGEMPFTCKWCSKQFTCISNMNAHMAKLHTNKYF